MRTAVPARVGKAKTYSFSYRANGAAVTVDAEGNLVTGGAVRTSRAVMVGADRKVYPCSGWARSGSSVSFTCDDSGLPGAAIPYTIDPVFTAAGSMTFCEGEDLGDSCHTNGGLFRSGYYVSIPEGVTVTDVTFYAPEINEPNGSCHSTYFVTPSGNVISKSTSAAASTSCCSWAR